MKNFIEDIKITAKMIANIWRKNEDYWRLKMIIPLISILISIAAIIISISAMQ